jgi:predicted GH43/DUF377 family glycosyl hydrolase
VRVFHTLTHHASRKFRYALGVAKMESAPPFRTTWVSPVPLAMGDERRAKAFFHSKPSVIFTCGVIKDGGDFLACISRDDDSTTLQRFSERQLGI